MKTTNVNNTDVFVIDEPWHHGNLISLAIQNSDFSIENEQECNYGRDRHFILNDGLTVYISEILEHQVEEEAIGDRFSLAFVKTIDRHWSREDGDQANIRYWKVEVFASEQEESEKADEDLYDLAGTAAVTKIGYIDTNLISIEFMWDGKKYEAAEFANCIGSSDGNIDTWGITVDGKGYKLGSGDTDEDDARDQQIEAFIIKQMKAFLADQEDLFDWEEGAAA